MTLETKDILNVSKETIAFQSGKFGSELEAFITAARRKYATTEEFIESKSSGQISEIIKKHTKLLVNIDIDYQSTYYNCGPAIFLPTLTNNHIFVENYIKPYLDKTTSERFIKSIADNKGRNGVNLKTSQVFGVLEDVETTMLLDAKYILEPFGTPAEITGVMLHEIGHLFTYFEYMSRTVTTNQVLSSLYDTLSVNKLSDERAGLIQSAAHALSFKGELDKDILEETDSRKLVIKLMRICFIGSETGSSKYDEASSEVLADQFATRHGYGLPLALYLAKISQESMSQSKIGRTAMYISESFNFAVTLGSGTIIAGVGVAGTAGLAVGVFSGILAFVIIGLAATSFNTTQDRFYTYDPFPTRLKKIKEQIIQATRQPGKSKSEITLLLEQIKSIDAFIKYSVDTSFLMNTIADFIRPFNKSPAANIALNRRLEELASNDLFVGAAKLKTLS